MNRQREYVLGTNDAELERLGFQHRVWSEQAFALWERAGFGSGATLLDVGCGPGFATLDLARLVGPAGRIIAVDESPRFVEHLRERCQRESVGNVDARVGDVQSPDVAAGTVDGAYARWVICFVPRPQDVVAAVARALRPRGVFAIQDYFNYVALALAPRSPILERVVAAIDASWRARAGDPDVVGRLPALCAAHGLRVREIRGHARVARPGSVLWQWPTTFFRNFVPTLVTGGYLSQAELEAFEREWAARSTDPNSFFATPPVYDVIAEKPA
ncbi:MAG: 2-phytyl-1,4-naphtoquinone methyltransferase [Phycisphaerae bacterium]|nr:2-phytyl-1,4-naphtoquinone methyltransferase [Phycisphaerae bacterium]